MKKNIIGLLIIAASLTTCNKDKGNPSDIFSKVYSEDNIVTQIFTINSAKDTIIKGVSGTTLHIPQNTFTDSSGQIVTGQINIELKEVLSPDDFVLGNLTTTSDGQFLQSGGMIYTNATANGKQLYIADNKKIGVAIPTDSTKKGMKLFEGFKDSTGINWKNPVSLNNAIEPQLILLDTVENEEDLLKRSTNVAFLVKGFEHGEKIPDELMTKISDVIWGGKGLILKKDSTIKIDNYTVELHKSAKILNDIQPDFSSTPLVPIKGTNTFSEDPELNYIFSLKKLGWANIDRFISDPRTKEVELITSIDNYADFNAIYVSMIVSNQKMYIPGYQKTDETYSFTHGDYERTSLPVGETATILATAYKQGKPYFAIKKIIITEKQTVSFMLEETTMDKLKADLKGKI